MRAAVLDGYGNANEVVKVKDVDMPRPMGDEVLVEIKASTVGSLDMEVAAGNFSFLTNKYLKKRPVVTGFEFAGIAKSKGIHIDEGEEVYGFVNILKAGVCHAEYAAIREGQLAKKPEGISFEEAASTTGRLMTAIDAFEEKVVLHAEDKVLINGAGGGVGVYAVQLAKKMGCEVTGTCSDPEDEKLKELGADKLVHYGKIGELLELGKKFDVIYDAAGKLKYGDVSGMMNPGGTYVTTNAAVQWKGEVMSLIEGNHVCRQMLVEGEPSMLRRGRKWVEEGGVQPVVDRVYGLNEIDKAFSRMEEHGKRGCVVVKNAS